MSMDIDPGKSLETEPIAGESLQPLNDPNDGSSYKQIIKTSSIVGGSKGANYVISLLRMKIVAVLLGPDGVGLIGLYQSTIGLVSTVSGLGIGSSGVREIAVACGSKESTRVSETVSTLRRVCWLTGVFGALIAAALAYPLSVWTFGDGDRAVFVAMLGVSVLINAISTGQIALLQGMRRIKEIALINIISAAIGTVIALLVYSFFGERGIVPVLIATSAANLATSWWFARRLTVPKLDLSWIATWHNSKSLLSLGLAFMWGAFLASAVALIIRSMIVRGYGLDAAGIYGAAWSLSGMFAGFVLAAMAADFYPRLTTVAHDNTQVNRLVNEQIEIGVLLALPGLLATLALAPWVIRLFYSVEFLESAELLPWLVLGVMFQVIGWPLGIIQRAKGASFWIYLSQTEANVLLLLLSLGLLSYYDNVIGVAFAMPCMYLFHLLVTYLIARHLSKFQFSAHSIRVQLSAIAFVVAGFAVQRGLAGYTSLLVGTLLTTAGTIVCVRGLVARIGSENRLIKWLYRIPGCRFVCEGTFWK